MSRQQERVDDAQYAARAEQLFPASVIMFSGCKDSQTSADVGNTAAFGLSAGAGPGGAGGACTNAMVKALEEKKDWTWVDLLQRMQQILRRGRYSQIPQLSSTRSIDLKAPFSVLNQKPSGRRRALLIGINYKGSRCPLNGCHNDVETMRRYLAKQGYKSNEMKLLMDNGTCERPTKSNMEAAMRWLVDGAVAGDSLFFHYSGHGTQLRDNNGDEADGKDEALCPVDFETAGMLRDDDMFYLLVAPLIEGVQLTCVLDCCHSGTILDLPYMFKADDDSLAAVSDGRISSMLPNANFDVVTFVKFVKKRPKLCAAAAVVGGIAFVALGADGRERLKAHSGLLKVILPLLCSCLEKDVRGSQSPGELKFDKRNSQ
eukprot:TRINITY_DN39679_c0_g1_i1.p1 TRINITY_DN39679_c0_g1~~TRINITY_DN39679_c0_g1_i1.p1  ORF type:complete len:390 (-),score=35.62 TRINITY_DN39679_c0_g1_i1:139-1257(-)